MTSPNLASVTTMNAWTIAGDLTASAVVLLDVSTSDAYKIESIFLCNADTANSCTATLELSVNNGSNYYYLCNGLVIPPATTISIIDRPIFLDEADLIRGTASAAGDIDYVISGTFIE